MTERLNQFSSAPPQTRMILSSDGSTTLLLDALIGEKLSVGVDHQQRVPAARLKRIGCHILGVAPEALVVDRQSRILNTNNDVISVNHVVIAGRDRDKLVPPPGELLGPYLKRAGLPLKREPLAVSHETWPLGSTSPECVCKEYIIDCGDAGRVYIHEKFNPRFVPPKKDGS
ncbi:MULTISPECIES: hypothetical protein [unclassified Streptomyces]|uniref:hypothetical protein n=1 Tax=Streptomyces sp. NPDC055082 TaxID=3365718 RepID=UPI0037CD209E